MTRDVSRGGASIFAALVASVVTVGAAGIAAAESPPKVDEGLSLLSEGSRLLMEGLMQELEPMMEELRQGLGGIDDLTGYHAPEILPNGDILIRKKQPTAEDGEIEL